MQRALKQLRQQPLAFFKRTSSLMFIPLAVLMSAGCGNSSDGSSDAQMGDANPNNASDDLSGSANQGDGSQNLGDGAVGDGSPNGSDGSQNLGDLAPQSFKSNEDGGKASPAGPAVVNLNTAANYVILAETAITNVSTSAVTGDIAISPGFASMITGFSLTNAGAYATSAQVMGKVYAADQNVPTPANLTSAVGDMQAAYTNASGRMNPNFLNLAAGNIGGLSLEPGLYKWDSAVSMTNNVTIHGGATDVFIFQITNDLTMAANVKVNLAGGALAKNIFWVVAGAVSLGVSAHLEGIVLCQTGVALSTSASVNGRLLAQTAVTLAKNTVTQPQ